MVRRASFRVASVLAMLVVAALLSACSSNSGGASSALHTTPAGNGTSASARQATTIVVKIPANLKLAATAAGRAPQYVSPATLSAGFLVYTTGSSPSSGIIGYADLSATSPLCVVAGDGSRSCSFSIQAPVGSNTFVMTLFDQALVGGAVPAGAAALSTNTVVYTVVADSTNSLTFDLDPIDTSVVLYPLSMSVTSGTAASFPITVIARDADDYIIGGDDPYTSPITLTISGDTSGTMSFSSSASVTSTVVANASVPVTLYYNGAAFTGTITLTATGPTTGTTMQITPGGSGSGTIGVLVPTYPTSAIVAATTNSFASFGANAVGNVVPTYKRTSSSQPGTNFFQTLAIDNSGNVYTEDNYYNEVAIWNAPLSNSSIVNPSHLIALPSGYYIYNNAIAIDSYGNVYVAASNGSAGAVVVFTQGSFGPTAARILTSNVSEFNPVGLAIDSQNDLFVADGTNDQIEEFAPAASGTASPIALITSYGSYTLTDLDGIALDPAGDIFVTVGHSVYEYAPGSVGSLAPKRSFAMGGCSLPTRVGALSVRRISSGVNPDVPVIPYANIAVDGIGNVYTTGVGEVCVYGPSASGTATPIDVITGSNTGLGSNTGTGIAVVPAGT